MNPSRKGWLKKYLEYRNSIDTRGELLKLLPAGLDRANQEQSLYRILQPTGLIYGHPVQLPYLDHPRSHEWTHAGKMSIILADSMINSVILSEVGDKSPSQINELTYDGMTRTDEYFRAVYPELFGSKSGWNKYDKITRAENILSSRLTYKLNSRSYWKSFFHNSLLFLDVYYFGQWFHQGEGGLSLDDVREQKNLIRFKILEVIAAAAHADDRIVKEEKELFFHFLDSAHLPPNLKAEAARFIRNPVSLEQLDLSNIDSWIVRKYIMELAMLTIWADREVNNPERKFILALGEKLRLPDQEIENSAISIESFVLGHWEDIHFLQGKHDLLIVQNHLAKRLGKLILKNKDRLAQEVRESKELVALLNKSRTASLTDEEKVKVREQLIDILKVIPTVVIIALPFTFITLPLLLKLLPRSAFPSAFQD